jgi:thiol-disulfide isomerase/thioredoxin
MRRFALLLLLLFACGAARRETPEEPRAGAAPVTAATGAQILDTVRSQHAAAVLVNVWATWCLTCREEFPDLLRLRRDLAPRGLAVLFVSGDFASELPAVREFLAAQGVDFPTYIKSGGDMELIDALQPEWSGALPASFVYDGGGVLVRWWQGSATYETFVERVEDLLSAEPVP